MQIQKINIFVYYNGKVVGVDGGVSIADEKVEDKWRNKLQNG